MRQQYSQVHIAEWPDFPIHPRPKQIYQSHLLVCANSCFDALLEDLDIHFRH